MKTLCSFLAAILISAGAMAQTVTIYEIQGQASASPYAGQDVTTHGIVTGVQTNNKGFYMQDGEGAWNGIFVYTNGNYSVSVGDDVSVTAEVQEYYEMTELSYISSLSVQSSGNQLPEFVIITAAQVQMEDYEGVLVRVENVTVTEMPDQYGIWTATDQNNDDLRVDNDLFSYTPAMSEVLTIVGVAAYTFDEYKINPRSIDDIIGGSAGQEVSIYDIQGQGAASPYEGQVISTSGIVTGVAFNGYAIQDGTGAWNGLFVYDSDHVPAIGDEVKVTGEVQEYYEMTELGFISSYSVESTGNQVPDVVTITALQAMMEDYESVLVQVQNIEVTELPDQYGVWRGVDGQGTTMVMDNDMYEDYSPNVGDHLNITGVMIYGFGEFKINPRMADDITPFIGIPENPDQSQIFLFPNPAISVLNISAEINISFIGIYGQSGNLIMEYSGLNNNQVNIKISDLPAGIYLVKTCFSDLSFTTQKFSVR